MRGWQAPLYWERCEGGWWTMTFAGMRPVDPLEPVCHVSCYEPAAGTLGEYNGKFMCGHYVLRGGSCATPAGHVRPTYRNFL